MFFFFSFFFFFKKARFDVAPSLVVRRHREQFVTSAGVSGNAGGCDGWLAGWPRKP
jgi:hypothetical protein